MDPMAKGTKKKINGWVAKELVKPPTIMQPSVRIIRKHRDIFGPDQKEKRTIEQETFRRYLYEEIAEQSKPLNNQMQRAKEAEQKAREAEEKAKQAERKAIEELVRAKVEQEKAKEEQAKAKTAQQGPPSPSGRYLGGAIRPDGNNYC